MEKKIIIAKLLRLSEEAEQINVKASDELISCAIKASDNKEYSESFNSAIDLIASVDYKVAGKMRLEAQEYIKLDMSEQYKNLTKKMTQDVVKVLEDFKKDIDTGKLADGMNKVKQTYEKMGQNLPKNISEDFNRYFTKINSLGDEIKNAEDKAREILMKFVTNTESVFSQLQEKSKALAESEQIEQGTAESAPSGETQEIQYQGGNTPAQTQTTPSAYEQRFQKLPTNIRSHVMQQIESILNSAEKANVTNQQVQKPAPKQVASPAQKGNKPPRSQRANTEQKTKLVRIA